MFLGVSNNVRVCSRALGKTATLFSSMRKVLDLMNRRLLRSGLAALGMVAGFASCGSAAVIHPVGVTTTHPTDVALLVVDNLINGSGMSLPNGSITDANIASVSHEGQVFGNGSNESTYTINDPNRPTLTFDLGGTFPVRSAYIWNYHDNDGFFGTTLSGNGASEATVTFELGGSAVGPSVVINPAEAPQVLGVDTLPSFHLLSAEGVLADKVLITLDDHFPGGDRVGLGEVRFSTVVPEPGAFAILATYLACCALKRRRF